MSDEQTRRKVLGILQQHQDKPFVKRVLEYKKGESPILVNPKDAQGNDSYSTHSMSANHSKDGQHIYVYPTVVMGRKGKLVRLSDEEEEDGRPALNNAVETGNAIEFDNLREAIWFSKHYKEGTGAMLDE